MTPFSKSGNSKSKKSVMEDVDKVATESRNRIDTPSRLNLDRQEIARLTEQKIDEIESAIKQDYLKNAKAAKEAAALEQLSISNAEARCTAEDSMELNTVLHDGTPLQDHDEEFEPTVIRTDSKFSLFNDESGL